MTRSGCVFILVMIFMNSLSAQNFDKAGKKGMLTLHGNINLNQMYYFTDELYRRDPFTWSASGGITLTILDIPLPFSYNWQNNRGNLSRPMNMLSFTPSYKWIKINAGYTSMNFSSYTLSGHLFAGGGMELTPGRWNIQLMFGRLNKTIENDSLKDNYEEASYKRYGYGMSTRYTSKKKEAFIIFWKGNDDPASPGHVPVNSGITPKDNLVISGGGKSGISKSLSAEGEYAVSILTDNIRYSEYQFPAGKIFSHLMTINPSTTFRSAYNFSFGFRKKVFGIKTRFERIDPGYKTLGGYFFSSDLENYTLNPVFALFQNKLNLNIDAGLQRNNLNNIKSGTTKRWIGNISVAIQPSPQYSITGSFSNFSTFTQSHLKTDAHPPAYNDTLDYIQVTKNGSLCIVIKKNNKKINSGLIFNGAMQESRNLRGNIASVTDYEKDETVADVSSGFTFSLTENIYLIHPGFSFALSCNFYSLSSSRSEKKYAGTSLQLSRQFRERKINMSAGTVLNRIIENNSSIGNAFIHRLTISCQPELKKGSGNFKGSLNLNWMQKTTLTGTGHSSNEITIQLTLSHNL